MPNATDSGRPPSPLDFEAGGYRRAVGPRRIRVGDEGRVQLTNFGAAYLWPDVEKRFPPEVRGERSSPLPLETLANRVLHFGPEDVRRATEALPEPLRRIVAKALRPDPDERYETAGRMRDELRAFLDRPGRQRPFGAKEARTEAHAIFDQASDLEKLGAYPVVERGILPLPPGHGSRKRRRFRRLTSAARNPTTTPEVGEMRPMKYGMLTKSLGKETRVARERLGLTQDEVAEQLDLVPAILGRIEHGHLLPSVPTLRRLAQVLGLSTDVLLALKPAEVAPPVEAPLPEGNLSPELRQTVRLLRGWSPGRVKMLNRMLKFIERTPEQE